MKLFLLVVLSILEAVSQGTTITEINKNVQADYNSSGKSNTTSREVVSITSSTTVLGVDNRGVCIENEDMCAIYYCSDYSECSEVNNGCRDYDANLDTKKNDGTIERCGFKPTESPTSTTQPISRATTQVIRRTATQPIRRPIGSQAPTATPDPCIDESGTEVSANDINLECPPPKPIGPDYIDYEKKFKEADARINNIKRHQAEVEVEKAWLTTTDLGHQKSIDHYKNEVDKNLDTLRSKGTSPKNDGRLRSNWDDCKFHWATVTKKLAQTITMANNLFCKYEDQQKEMSELKKYYENIDLALDSLQKAECRLEKYLLTKLDEEKRSHYQGIHQRSCHCYLEIENY